MGIPRYSFSTSKISLCIGLSRKVLSFTRFPFSTMPSILSKVNVKFPCNLCSKPVANNHRALCCDICDQWVHIKCNNVSPADYERLKSSESRWFCLKCIGCVFPRSTNLFDDVMPSSLPDDTTNLPPAGTNDGDISKAAFLNSIFLPEPSTDPDSDSTDDDNTDTPADPPMNCRYYDSNSLSSTLKNCHSSSYTLFHLNIASLSQHADELHTLLHSLDHRFSVIGITETKINTATIPQSLAIPNYNFVHTPAKATKGGAALFVKTILISFLGTI